MRIDRTTMVMGAGAGVGVIQTVLTKEYIDPTFGPIPFVGQYLPYPWGNWSTFGNIVIGGICFGVATFTNVFSRKPEIGNFLSVYGITTLIGGFMNGIFPGTAPLRAAAPALRAAVAPSMAPSVAPITPTGIPPTTILA